MIMSTKNILFALALAALVVACDNTPATPDSGPRPDTGGGGDEDGGGGGDEDGGGGGDVTCAEYCGVVTANCSGANAQYADMADCMAYCATAGWPAGTRGEAANNTLACRTYHGGTPATGNAGEHCPHAGPTGGSVCGTIDFRTTPAAMYSRVDRMGMPAVSTALIGSAMKNAYNDANPQDDADGDFVGELATQLTMLHAALDDDLAGLNLDQCSMTNDVNGVPVVAGVTLPECFGQEVAPGVTVASLVLPDTLRIDPDSPAGFPNGRGLADPVIDVTLAIILLDLDGTCGAGMCSAGTLAGVPVNPTENDIFEGEFLPTFPYLQPAQAP